MFILEKTQDIFKVEIMNNSFDWINPLMTFISVFLGAFLAYYFTNKIENKKYKQQKKEIFINELIEQCNKIYNKHIEISHLISRIEILDDNDNFKEKLNDILEKLEYCLNDLYMLYILVQVPLEQSSTSKFNNDTINYADIYRKMRNFILSINKIYKKSISVFKELDKLSKEDNINMKKIRNKAKEIDTNINEEIFFDCIKELKRFLFE